MGKIFKSYPGIRVPSPEERRIQAGTSLFAWSLVLALVLLDAVLFAVTRLSLDRASLLNGTLLILIFAPVSLFYRFVRYDPLVSNVADALALMCAFGNAFCILSYLVTALGAGLPLWDVQFAAADRALGLDWRAFLAWYDAHPFWSWLLGHAYTSILYQAVVAAIVLALLGQYERLQVFVLAGAASLMICCIVAGLMPAVGVFHHLGIDAKLDHPHVDLLSGTVHLPHYLALRDGSLTRISFFELHGIISLPSFHTAVALLFVWIFWRVAVLRWVAVAVNGAMIAATPIHGGHYFVDLGAGALVAVAALAWASSARRRLGHGLQRQDRAPVLPGAEAVVRLLRRTAA